ncbi:hypothetical protein [Paenibacillus sp. GCM10023250]|uniref:hypothetical protein n=1 Tax=Paenibacillus sp. GCM10023250 TaxID=3252648 RepID=UPI003613DFC3
MTMGVDWTGHTGQRVFLFGDRPVKHAMAVPLDRISRRRDSRPISCAAVAAPRTGPASPN